MCTFVHRYLGFVVKTKVTKKGRIPSEETDLNFRDVKKFSGHQYKKTQFGHLAMLYYPNLAYKAALRMFRKELEHTRDLFSALQDMGYEGKERLLSPRQVRVIEEYLGEA